MSLQSASSLKNNSLCIHFFDNLPDDIINHIDSFCELPKHTNHCLPKYELLIFGFLLNLSVIMYWIGYLISGHNSGVYILFNFLIGYILICAFLISLLLVYILFNISIDLILFRRRT